MKPVLLAAGWVFAVAEQASTNPLLQVLIAALGGGFITVGLTRFLDRRKTQVETDDTALAVAQKARQLAADSMADIDAVRKEMQRLGRELQAARVRIQKLEEELETARGGRERLLTELQRARDEVVSMRVKMTQLELALQGKEPRREHLLLPAPLAGSPASAAAYGPPAPNAAAAGSPI